nr:chloroperoxidase [Quercus suber]
MLPLAIAALLTTVFAIPSLHPYIGPGPTDSRGPCPGLNTLANHGYISRDGRNIERQSIIDAFRDQFGIDQSCINIALSNALTVCEYVTGASCGTTLKNLSLLAEPHAFEHDHSFSREDYKMRYLANADDHSDNRNFNRTIFQTSLDVLNGSSHMNYQVANEVRLQRESLAMQDDYPGWFIEQKSIQELEVGFIFAVMGDFNLPGYPQNPQVRVDWWDYWFSKESFPYALGWRAPTRVKDLDFILSVSSAVLAQTATSKPTPLPSGAIGSASPAGFLPTPIHSGISAIPTDAPYAARNRVLLKNPYLQSIDLRDIKGQRALVMARSPPTATVAPMES